MTHFFSQGDDGDNAYMIVFGHLEVIVDEKKRGTMRDGELFGELAFLLNQKRSATIRAGSATELVSISKKNLEDLVSSGSDSAKEIINELCKSCQRDQSFKNLHIQKKN